MLQLLFLRKMVILLPLKIADDNQEFLNRSYIDANGSIAGCKYIYFIDLYRLLFKKILMIFINIYQYLLTFINIFVFIKIYLKFMQKEVL